MTGFDLFAPCRAWLAPLGEVPDEAFASAMLGPGVALDPLEGAIRAPCDGEIIGVAPTGHSITLRHPSGADVLIHIGVDTVALAGEGFEPRAAIGANVRRGDELMRFDLDGVARRAPSVMTPLIVLGEDFALAPVATGRIVDTGDKIAVVTRVASGDAAASVAGEWTTRRVDIALAHGIHARPAARLANALKSFDAEAAIALGERRANARSVTALLKLGVRHGDPIELCARGGDAAAALDAMAAVLRESEPEIAVAASPSAPPPQSVDPGAIHGTRAAPGGALGVAKRLDEVDLAIPDDVGPADTERAALEAATDALRGELGASADRSGIAAAHLAIVDDPELRGEIERGIGAGLGAAAAVRAALRREAGELRAGVSPLLAERAADLLDVERRLVARLLGGSAPAIELPESAVVIADELLPSTFLSLDRARVAAIVTATGGPTSHVALLAEARGIPMLVGCGAAVLAISDGTPLLVDPSRALLRIEPDRRSVAAFLVRQEQLRAQAESEAEAAHAECRTRDDARIEVFANCGSAADAELAARGGAEGCGLLRTEFLFLERERAPSEYEQAQAYGAIAAALPARPIIVRTLDAGSDKALPYLPQPAEPNPALGTRGIRLMLAHPLMLAEQFRAILRGVPPGQCRIMLPMVVDLAELRAARAILREAERDLGLAAPTPLGIMVETPSAALLAGSLAREAEFLSIGSNDLTQYALAADRQNPAVTGAADALHPAVLRLIAMTAEGAHSHDRWLGVCGGIASDPAATPLLLGLGVDELSVSPPAVPAIKARVRGLEVSACRSIAQSALNAATATEVRQLLEETADALSL